MLGVEIDRIFSDRRLKTKVSELDIKVEDVKTKELIDIVKDLTVTEAVGLVYGLDSQIKISLRQESKEKWLEDLKIELL